MKEAKANKNHVDIIIVALFVIYYHCLFVINMNHVLFPASAAKVNLLTC